MKKSLVVIEEMATIFWLGTTYVVSLLVIPTTFSVLPKPYLGEFLKNLFPIYFHVTGISLILVAICHGLFFRERNFPRARTTLIGLSLLATALNFFWVLPTVEMLRATMLENPQAFQRWHGVSMGLNLVVMIAGLPLLIFRGFAHARFEPTAAQS